MAVLAPPVRAAMRSRLLLRVRAGAAGTVLDVVDCDGQLVARQTGQGEVHLVSQAAGPLNGDVLDIRVEVGPGARLAVGSTAAAIALPCAGRDPGAVSTIRTTLVVAAGAHLNWHPEPLVVASGAVVDARTQVHLAAGATLDYRDTIVLGRHGETGGDVRAQLRVVRDDVSALSQTLDSAVLDRAGRWTAQPERVVASALLVRSEPWGCDSSVAGPAVAMQPEPGVLLACATGARHTSVTAALVDVVGAATSARGS